jgi:predicted metal-dependent peptidase
MVLTQIDLERREKLSKALMQLLLKDYLYAVFFQQFDRKIEENLGFKGCAYMNGNIPTIVMDSDTIDNDEQRNIIGVLRHEAWHLMLEHPQRTEPLLAIGEQLGFDHQTILRCINIAADLVVNQYVPDEEKYGSEVEIKAFGYEPGKTMEYYAKLLMEKTQQITVTVSGNGSTGDLDIDVQIKDNSKLTEEQAASITKQIQERVRKEIYAERHKGTNTGPKPEQQIQPKDNPTNKEASQAGDKDGTESGEGNEESSNQPSIGIGNSPGSSLAELSPGSVEAIQWKTIINNAVMDAKAVGAKIPSQVKSEEFELKKDNKINVLSLLNRYATASVRFNKRKPSKRFGIPPKSELKSSNDYSLVVAIDTSGSLWGSSWITRFFETAIDLWRRGIKIYLIQCDTEVKYAGELNEESVEGLQQKGGGGTNFAPVFIHIRDKELEPRAILFLTDGMNFDNEATIVEANKIRGVKVIWLITDNGIIPGTDYNGVRTYNYPGEFYKAGVDFD